eukprot:Skav207506  [mRNA]  locus=scaffold334:363407:364966:- [translate_table: standard]
MHTPRGASRKQHGSDNAVPRGCVAETPEKIPFPKSGWQMQTADADALNWEKTVKDPSCFNPLNADADEFIPGSFGPLFLPAILPAVPVNPSPYIPSFQLPPGLEMCGLTGITQSIWDEITTHVESAWEQSSLSTHLSSSPTSEASPKQAEESEENPMESRTLKIAACLLRFLIQAPVLETSDLLKIIESQLGEAGEASDGPWRQRDLRRASFSCKDLALLDARLAALLDKISPEALARLSKQAKLNLAWDPAGMVWSFNEPPELRRLVAKKDKSPTLASSQFSITFLSQRSGYTPMQLDRMLEFKRAGIACLQGLDSNNPDLAARIFGKGYGRCCTHETSEANTIIWDRSFWTFCGSYECDAGLAVDLISEHQAIRIACWRPSLEHCCDASSFDFGCLLSENVNLVICADMSLLGGTSSAGLVPALLGLQSAMFETLGHEVLVPMPKPCEEALISDEAHADLNPLWDPCGIFFGGVEASAALSGYTEGYLAAMTEGDVKGNFPDGKPILFAEFGIASVA